MRHEEHVEERYFAWLCQHLGIGWDNEPPTTLVVVAQKLHEIPFAWMPYLPMDANRAEDGLELRRTFGREEGLNFSESSFWDVGASVLEVFAALADRASLQNNWPVEEWFLRFLENLGIINRLSIAGTRTFDLYLQNTIQTWMLRQYEPNGVGGLFPLQNPYYDQRTVEIWSQMGAYIIEEMEDTGFLTR